MKTDGIERRIREAQSAAMLEAAVQDLEDDLLDVEDLPSDFFRVFSLAFEDTDIFSKDGAWHIVFALTNERHRLNLVHLQTLKRSILGNFADYPDQLHRHTVCDFIARAYQPHEAFGILEQLRMATSTKDTLTGFDILSKHAEWDAEVARRAKELISREAC